MKNVATIKPNTPVKKEILMGAAAGIAMIVLRQIWQKKGWGAFKIMLASAIVSGILKAVLSDKDQQPSEVMTAQDVIGNLG